MGAALASGAGIAHAEDGSDAGGSISSTSPGPSASSSSSNSPSTTSGPAAPNNNSPTTSVDNTPSSAAPASSTSSTSPTGKTVQSKSTKSPKTTLSFSGGFLKLHQTASAPTKQKATNDTTAAPKAGTSGDSTTSEATTKSEKSTGTDTPSVTSIVSGTTAQTEDPTTLSVLAAEPVPTSKVSAVPAATISTIELAGTTNKTAQAAKTPASNTALQTLALSTTLAATDPRDAYLQQFINADPTDRFSTPASPEYDPRNVGNTTTATLDAQIAEYGTTGFSRDRSNSLVYTNHTTTDVAILYSTKLNGEAEGIRIVKIGASTTIPGGPNEIALAQAPKTINPDGSITFHPVALAAPGYVTSGSGSGSTGTGGGSKNPVKAITDSIGQIASAVTKAFGSTIGGLVRDGLSFTFDYLGPAIQNTIRAQTKATFDALSSIQKDLVFGNAAKLIDDGAKLGPTLFDITAKAFAKVNIAFSAYAIYEAYQASQNAKTVTDQFHAGALTIAAEAPLAGLAIGFVVAGPPGAVVGGLIGGVVSIGVGLGDALTRFHL